METRETWRIDPERSTLRFSLHHALLGAVSGQFECWGGQVLLDRADPRRSAVRIWVDLSSIDTGSQKRDDYILNTALFDVRWEPGLVFDGEHVEVHDARHAAVVGWLTLHSHRKEIAVTVDALLPQGDASSAHRFVGVARASIDRADFGLRRSRQVGDWLSEQLLGKTIEMVAHIEVADGSATSSPLPLQ